MSRSTDRPADNTRGARREVGDLRLLNEVSQLLEQSLDLRTVISPVLEALTEYLDLEHCTLTLSNRETGELYIDVAHGSAPPKARASRHRLREGFTGQVVATGQPAVIERISDGDGSFVCVPIKTGSEIDGALSVERRYQPGYDLSGDERLLSIVGSMIAQGVRLRREAEEERERLETENERLRAELKDRYHPSNIVGTSREMQLVYEQIARVSRGSTTVLVLGETGTGKELVAQAIHYASERADQPFVKLHCAALPEGIVESELFGHVRGGFTGAVADRTGRFELAHGGTLFLDEVGDIPPTIQIKLLRVLQERELERVGGSETLRVDVRLIAATNRDLAALVREGQFREDLFYRLNVFPIEVPPLRKRKADVALLADLFLERYARANRRGTKSLSTAVVDMLMSYHWPGNVRELESCIERAVLVSQGEVILPQHLPPTLQTAEATGSVNPGSLRFLVESFERDLIREALKSARGSLAGAARVLETTQRVVGYKIKKYGLDPSRFAG